jgi:hypothetical protein
MTTGTRDIVASVRSLSPQALAIFKKNLKVDTLNPTVRQRLESMPELSDVFRTSQPAQTTKPEAKPWEYTSDMNLWQKGLKTFTMPFDIIGRYVTEPFGTIVTSPFTKDVPGTEGMSWYERERASYDKLNPWLKFGIESLPWLMIPGAGAVGTAERAGSGVAGALGRMGSAGKIAGTLVERSPWGLTEKATSAVLKGAGKAIGITGKTLETKTVDSTVEKLTGLIKQFKPTEAENRALLRETRQQQSAIMQEIFAKNPSDVAFRKAQNALKGEVQKATVPVFEQMSKEEVLHLKDVIKNYEPWSKKPFNKLATETALTDLFTGTLPTKYDNQLLEEVFGSDIVKALLEKRSFGTKAFDNFMNAVGMPKALVASFDLSAPARQGIMLVGEKSWWKSWKPMMQALVKEENAISINKSILENPLRQYQEAAKLYIAPFQKLSGGLEKMEESFMTNLAEKMPWVKTSERAYVTYLNKLRSDTFNSYVGKWLDSGMTTEEVTSHATVLADFINKATGRGNLMGLERSGTAQQVLNAAFFSPRFVASRVQVPWTVFTKDAQARGMIAKNLGVFFGGGMAALTLIKASGAADVELNPTSTDFGKIKIGNTRIDFWGGFQPLARYTAQFLTDTRTSITGATQEVNKLETLGRFTESKLSPTTGLILSYLRENNFIGQPVGTPEEDTLGTSLNMVTPMFLQDLITGFMDSGLLGAGLSSLSGVGASVTTYPVGDTRNLASIPLVNEIAQPDPRETQAKLKYGKSYAELSPAQKGSIRNDPAVRTQLTPTSNEKKSYDLYDQQIKDDQLFQSGQLSGSDWRERMYDRLAERSWMQNQYEGTYGKASTPEGQAMSMYYSFFDGLGDNPLPDELSQAMQMADTFIASLPQEYQDYIEENRYPDATPMMQEFKSIQKALKPYWNITNQVWSQYDPSLKAISDQLDILANQDERAYKLELRKYPQIVRAKKMIALQKLRYKRQNPAVSEYLKLFYSY